MTRSLGNKICIMTNVHVSHGEGHYDHHPSSSTMTVLGVGDATDRAPYVDAADGGLYDGVGAALLTKDAVDPECGYRCLGACMESHTEVCGGVSMRAGTIPLARPTGVRERSPNTVLARESGRGGDVFLVGVDLLYDGMLVTVGRGVWAWALLSSASRRAS